MTIEWNKYIKWGKFISKHGIELPFKWEFDRIETAHTDAKIITAVVRCLAYPYEIVAINTVHPHELVRYCTVYYPHTELFNIEGKYIIYDDVITTGKTIDKCIEKIGREPEAIICIVDRRGGYKNTISIIDMLEGS